MPFNGDTVEKQSLGGSESAAYYLARELARRGHRVICWTTASEDSERDGVKYLNIGSVTQATPLGERFEFYATHSPHDVLIIQRLPHAFHKRYAAKVCIWQLHDLALYRSAGQMLGGMWQVDAVTCVSDWHREQVKEVWNLSDEILKVVPNGVDASLYSARMSGFVTQGVPGRDAQHVTLPVGKYTLLYQSRPERGLEHLVRAGGIMDRLRDSPVHLMICGYDNTVPQMAMHYQELMAQAAALPNVSWLGALTKRELSELQRKADLLIYPTEFCEVSCITAMEAMHASLPMLSSHHGALPETCKGAGAVLLSLKDGKADEDAFVEWIQGVFTGKTYPQELSRLRMLQQLAAKERTWACATDRLLDVVDEVLAKKSAQPAAILRSAIERSDIQFAKWYASTLTHTDAIVGSSIKELERLYAFGDSEEAYAAHYARHQGVYYDSHEEQVIGEDVTRTTRFRGVQGYLVQHCHQTQNIAPAVLDYGCAHGHYTIPLSRIFPKGKFLGIDVSARAVAAARKWVERESIQNVSFENGAQSLLKEMSDTFDVIIAGEVLEHVPDAQHLLETLRKCLKPGGVIIVTTPYGRWEHSGTEAFRTGREHLHHFERQDIEDICRGHHVDIAYAPAGKDKSGEAMGSWVWMLRPEALPLWKPDYQRKLRQFAPRETISACLIVKDGERTIRKCIESFIDWVDEVIVCVDPLTTDRTRAILSELAADFPNRPFTVCDLEAPVLKSGFDEARNASISRAAGDWILWCDADEEIHNPWALHSLARHSMHNGYGCPQVHYSVSPSEVLTTDYPCRLFRNRQGIRFFGVVHEHPEHELGTAVRHSIVRPDIKFLHCGYVDEEIRRKRYQRNLPLLARDRQKYPERELNKFLWLRDLAQGMMFEQEQMGGAITPDHVLKAKEGIKIMEELVSTTKHVRMISDAMPYYTHCVATSGSGFESEINVKAASHHAPDLAVSYNIKGVFHTREFYQTVTHRFLEESTKHYEDRYL